MQLAPGTVLCLYFPSLRPFPKEKLCVLTCLEPTPLLLLINSDINPFVNFTEELVSHHLAMLRSDYPSLLDYDSWLDCTAPLGYDYEALIGALKREPHRVRGVLSGALRTAVVSCIENSRLWPPKKADRVLTALASPAAIDV